jgi:hypothetical protein
MKVRLYCVIDDMIFVLAGADCYVKNIGELSGSHIWIIQNKSTFERRRVERVLIRRGFLEYV